ncbi:unnamed protein product [Diabrotica balteata]|uniref:Protein tipE n=2 Tax=Diabrotica TaxID=50385 RepID=A0A6P7FIY9_DIAVI|nr:protein tipE [Diabrotica virgifera virgifera]CAG9828468.1 unnamed protein product [Diabrotica balteata]
MRSSSSELLLDQQEELRRQKIKELAAAKKSKIPTGRSCREQAIFYSTSVLAVMAMSAGSSLLFLVPLYVDPAISTLASNFVTEPVTCVTTRIEELTGLANCSWSSCREGCTSDAYHCTHIYVSYNNSKEDPHNQTDDAVLLVNIKGCGYPPSVLCLNFTETYGVEGTEFPCYHSRQNRTVVLTHYERDEQIAIIIHYFAVPFIITLATSVALCVMHCDCRCHPTTHHKRPRRPRIQDLSDGSINIGVDLRHNTSYHSDLAAIRPT